ncbi:MAG: 5-formyltetrahydrofolate cyclo-ligase [Oscillospiraceae bacterium]
MERIIKSDIREVKKALREKYKGIRANMKSSAKLVSDNEIYLKFINCDSYKNAKTIFTFVSTNIEVDTIKIIKQALLDKKVVAVPKCLDKNGKMAFYQITSFDDLSQQTYGLLEPNINTCKKISEYYDAVCIVPGFSFDPMGYRIGFGKGFYDRFLSEFVGIKIGICYNNCIDSKLPHGRYDIAVNYIITEKYTITVRGNEN